MAEQNGDQNTRLDRIERALEMLIADHEQFRLDQRELLTAQVIQSQQIGDLLKITQKHTRQFEKQDVKIAALDARVDKVVLAIGDLISRMPPQEYRDSR